jgi:hypothetical protein
MNKSEERTGRSKYCKLDETKKIIDKLQKLARDVPNTKTSWHNQIEDLIVAVEKLDDNVHKNFSYGLRVLMGSVDVYATEEDTSSKKNKKKTHEKKEYKLNGDVFFN